MQRDGAEPDAALLQEPAARNGQRMLVAVKMCLTVHGVLLLGDRFVEIQQHARDHGLGGQFSGRRALGQVGIGAALAGGQSRGIRPSLRQCAVPPCAASPINSFNSSAVRLAPDAPPKRVGDPFLVVAAVVERRRGPGPGRIRRKSISFKRGQRLQRRVGARRRTQEKSPLGASKVCSTG